jgi:catechol 2,3-dioxygenase-like lactoylglutathione lyase family enzyme
MENGNLDFVVLNVPDLAAARAFYTGKLGLEVEAESPEFIQFRRASGAVFALQPDTDATSYSGLELWWHVENADQAHDELAAKGIPIAEPLTDRPFGRVFAVSDPAGNILRFLQPRQS